MSEFNNSNNQNTGGGYNRIDVNTSMMTIWDSATGNQLKLSLLNNGLGISIWLPQIDPSGYRKYPTENRYNIVVNPKGCIALEKVINDIIIPAYERGNNAHAGVFTNNNNTNMLELEVRDGIFFIIIHRGIDPVSRIPKDTIRFKFESTNIVDNYNSANGEMEITPVQADFFIFVKAVLAYNTLAGGYYAAHGTSIASAQFNTRFMEYIRSIAEAVHAQLPAPSYHTNGGYQAAPNTGLQQNYNVNNVAAAANLPNINPTEVTTLSDLVG